VRERCQVKSYRWNEVGPNEYEFKPHSSRVREREWEMRDRVSDILMK
jgi:hypothetical protein